MTAPVMASEARPSIFEARGDGLPRYARSDGIFDLLFKVCVGIVSDSDNSQ